jgi:hypothetical protein
MINFNLVQNISLAKKSRIKRLFIKYSTLIYIYVEKYAIYVEDRLQLNIYLVFSEKAGIN